MIKLIASDMDGTLLNHNHKIPKENVELINYAKNQGLVLMVVLSMIKMVISSV